MAEYLENFDVKLQEFNKSVLEKITKKKGVKKTDVINVLNTPKKVGVSNLNSTLSQWTAYLFRYSPCYTSALADQLSKMVIRNPTIFRDILEKGSIHVCCLGGNLALEAVALSQILSSFRDEFCQSNDKPLHLKITVLDQNRQWKNTALDVIQALTEDKDIFDASRIAISLEFERANFSKTLEDDAVKPLREADIVTMVNCNMPPAELPPLVEDISSKMKDGSVLFYLNTGFNMQWLSVEKSLRVFKCIYDPVQLEVFTLNLNSIQRCISLFWQDYSHICLTSCIINACAWIKTTDTKYNVKLPRGKASSRMTRQQWNKKKEESEKMLAEFHSKIHAIVPKKTLKKKDPKVGSHFTGVPQRVCKKDTLFSTKGKDKRIAL